MNTRVDTSNLIKTNIPGYYKDPRTNTIINVDNRGLDAYKFGIKKSLELKELRSELDKIKKALGI